MGSPKGEGARNLIGLLSSMITLIFGGAYADKRGSLTFCNDFDMQEVRRFYTISNSRESPCRGWIGHKRETKWFFPIKGSTEIIIESMNGKERQSVLLASTEPAVLKVEPGNWFCINQDGNAEVMVFSNCCIGDSRDDDLRRPL